MKNRVRNLLLFSVMLLSFTAKSFQGAAVPPDSVDAPEDWFLQDPDATPYAGVSVERAYGLLANRPSKTVIVAIIDSGIDIDHEDLSSVIWTNENEIPGNGIDDDHNGYIDDIHGWNFIGGKDGRNVDADTYEVTREYIRLKDKYENADENKISKKDKKEFAYWKKVKAKYDNDSKFNNDQYEKFKDTFLKYLNINIALHFYDSILRARFNITEITSATLKNIQTDNDTLVTAKNAIERIFDSLEGEDKAKVTINDLFDELDNSMVYIQDAVEHYGTAVEIGYSLTFNSREIVGDDVNNPTEKGYGNNDVKGPDPSHGTHVAGIIGANRKNDIGIKGIADNVKIMSVRAVPNGDERDKDIANAIYYAVDNGARVVNMSFGKSFSPQKELVDKAVKYAESKGVLLIHAAGNDHDNIDVENNFPTRVYKNGKVAANWMEIGASTSSPDETFVASFSNYGKKNVDLFAPGQNIYSTTPDNHYESKDGTSMASPVATGVAALIMSYFPELTDIQVKEVLRQSTRKYDNLKVTQPGSEDLVPFNQLSSSEGEVNSYNAVQAALKLTALQGSGEINREK